MRFQKDLNHVFVFSAVNRASGVWKPQGLESGCVVEQLQLEIVKLLYSLLFLVWEGLVSIAAKVFKGLWRLLRVWAVVASEVRQHAWARTTWIQQNKLDILYLARLHQQKISIPSDDIAGRVLLYRIFEQFKPLLILLIGENPSEIVVLSQLHSLIPRRWAGINNSVLLLLSPFLPHSFQQQVRWECAAEALHHAGWRLQQI